MKFLLTGFEEFMAGNGIWIVIGVLAAALIVTVVFLILNILKAKKIEKAEAANKPMEEIIIEKEEKPAEQVIIPTVEEKLAEIKPIKKATTRKLKKVTEIKDEKKAESPKTVYGITYDKEAREWVVKKSGASRASKRCATKAEAMKVAEKLSETSNSTLRVHKKDGKFQKQ